MSSCILVIKNPQIHLNRFSNKQHEFSQWWKGQNISPIKQDEAVCPFADASRVKMQIILLIRNQILASWRHTVNPFYKAKAYSEEQKRTIKETFVIQRTFSLSLDTFKNQYKGKGRQQTYLLVFACRNFDNFLSWKEYLRSHNGPSLKWYLLCSCTSVFFNNRLALQIVFWAQASPETNVQCLRLWST